MNDNKSKISEVDLAAAVISWLQEMNWEVYQEVQIYRYGGVCDIVATQNNISWFIECKKSLGIAVMEQAFNWRWLAHYVSIATPAGPSKFCENILSANGIGDLVVSKYKEVTEMLPPKLNRKADKKIFSILSEDHKTFAAAGNNNGQHWSGFKRTCRDIFEAVRETPGINLKKLLESIDTHYASTATARACIAHWGKQGKIPGVVLKRNGRNLEFYPSEN